MQLIDTHCHFDFFIFSGKRDAIIQKCLDKKIAKIIIPAVASSDWNKLIFLARQYVSIIRIALGLHPLFLHHHTANDLCLLDTIIKKTKPIAIGEIGLDYYDKHVDKEKQKYFFEQQITIAQKYHLPLLIHARKSHYEVLAILKKYHFNNGGIIHAFNGSFEQASEYIKLNFKLGFGGMVTYPNATNITKLIKALPLSAIVLETDAPDMPLYKQKEAYNSPENILLIAQNIATMRNVSLEEIARQTSINVKAILNV